jgi:transposase
LSTKIHATCDALGNPTSFFLTEGQQHDLDGSDQLLPKLLAADAVLADKAYDADERVILPLKEKGVEVVIPPKKNRLEPRLYDKYLYKSRHLIENFFAKLKNYRAIATRYDKLDISFLSGIFLVASTILLK